MAYLHRTLAHLLLLVLSAGGAAEAQKSISIGLQAGGTMSWVTFAIERYKLE